MLQKGDLILDKAVDIENHVVDYYYNLFASNNACVDNNFVAETIPKLVSGDDNFFLTNPPTLEEVKTAIFSMSGNGAPGPDGFRGAFLRNFGISLAWMFTMLFISFSSKGGFYPISTLTWLF